MNQRMIKYKGQTKNLTERAREIGISPQALHYRLSVMSVREAMTRPVRKPSGLDPKEYKRLWDKENREKNRIYKQRYREKRLKENPNFHKESGKDRDE